MLSSWESSDAYVAVTHFLPYTACAAPAALCAQRIILKCTETSDSNGKHQQFFCLYFRTGFFLILEYQNWRQHRKDRFVNARKASKLMNSTGMRIKYVREDTRHNKRGWSMEPSFLVKAKTRGNLVDSRPLCLSQSPWKSILEQTLHLFEKPSIRASWYWKPPLLPPQLVLELVLLWGVL